MPAEWPWFRMFAEARVDAKLRVLTSDQHRVWFHLLCYASEQPIRGEIHAPDDYLLAVECAGGDEALLRETLAILERLEIISEDIDDRIIRFLSWESRQYDKPSDRPEATAERQRQSRAKKGRSRDVTPMSRAVTRCHDPEEEEELEREKDEKQASHLAGAPNARQRYPEEFESFLREYGPTNGPKKPAFVAWQRLSRDQKREAVAGLSTWHGSKQWREGFKPYPQKYLTQRFWEGNPEPFIANGQGPPGTLDPAFSRQIDEELDRLQRDTPEELRAAGLL